MSSVIARSLALKGRELLGTYEGMTRNFANIHWPHILQGVLTFNSVEVHPQLNISIYEGR
jgi:hypothetical protein